MKLRYGLVPAIFLGLGILAVQAKDKAAGASDLAKLRPVDEMEASRSLSRGARYGFVSLLLQSLSIVLSRMVHKLV